MIETMMKFIPPFIGAFVGAAILIYAIWKMNRKKTHLLKL